MRDTRRTIEYWQNYHTYRDKLIGISEQVLTRPNITERHQSSALFNLFMHRSEILLALYSRGDDKATLAAYLPSVIDSLENYLDKGLKPFEFPSLETYVQALWLLSFGILLNVSSSNKKRIAVLTQYVGIDALLDRLRHALGENSRPHTELRYPDIYKPLLQAFTASVDDQKNLLQIYLMNYYANMAPTYWHGRHLLTNKSYFGYWSVETAAVVKLIGLDDSFLQRNEYYPRGLL